MLWPSLNDYQEAIQNPRFCFADSELQGGQPVLNRLGLPMPISGNFACVYQTNCNGRKWAVRCFLRYHTDQERRYSVISQYLRQIRLPYMAGFEFLSRGIKIKGQWYPFLKMEWVEGETLNRYIEKNLRHPRILMDLIKKFKRLAGDLRRYNVAHGDLQHANIIIAGGDIRLIDYDGMYVPGLKGMPGLELGHQNYQHPKRTEQCFNNNLDNFSLWVILTSLTALIYDPGLWDRLGAGDECLLFRRKDFENPDSSPSLHVLEQIKDNRINGLAYALKSFVGDDFSKVPSINTIPYPKKMQVKPQPVQHAQLPAWMTDYVIKKENADSAGKRNNLFAAAPFFLILLAAAGAFLAFLFISGSINLLPAILMAGVIALSTLLFTFRRKFFPGVLHKLGLKPESKRKKTISQ